MDWSTSLSYRTTSARSRQRRPRRVIGSGADHPPRSPLSRAGRRRSVRQTRGPIHTGSRAGAGRTHLRGQAHRLPYGSAGRDKPPYGGACPGRPGVVSLKGGDPFVFGRGGEEGRVLYQAGIPFEVVPGISSELAVPAYAGIPLTLRGVTSHCTLVTGHEDPLKDTARLDWDKLASGVGTLVIFMGVKNLPHIVANLMERGRPGSTPVASIRHGTLATQQTVVGTLDDIVDRVSSAGLRPPALIVVGEVVRRREELRRFAERQFSGRRVVVTRHPHQAAGQIELIREIGARPILFPTIRVEPVLHSEQIEGMLCSVSDYELVVFTSANGVGCFFDRLNEASLDVRALG